MDSSDALSHTTSSTLAFRAPLFAHVKYGVKVAGSTYLVLREVRSFDWLHAKLDTWIRLLSRRILRGRRAGRGTRASKRWCVRERRWNPLHRNLARPPMFIAALPLMMLTWNCTRVLARCRILCALR